MKSRYGYELPPDYGGTTRSRGELLLGTLVIIVLLLAAGYFAWQAQQITESLNRIAAAQKENSIEIKASRGRMEEQIAKLRKDVRLPSVKEWVRAMEKPLAALARSAMGEAQRRGIEDALRSWSEKTRRQEEKRWQGLLGKLSKDRMEVKKQYLREEEFRKDLIKTLREERKTEQKRQRQEEKRWLNLTETLKKNREADQKGYSEVVRRLNEERNKAQERARQLEEVRRREISKLLDQAKEIEQERKRQMSEFCTRRPESEICRGL